jgi:hypothetical protein
MSKNDELQLILISFRCKNDTLANANVLLE